MNRSSSPHSISMPIPHIVGAHIHSPLVDRCWLISILLDLILILKLSSTSIMRFPWRARCKPAAERDNLLPSPTSARDVESWRTVRLSYVWMLRRNTKFIILLMAMMEALKHGTYISKCHHC